MTDDELPLEIDCRTVHSMLGADDDFLLLDCREEDEFAAASIAASTLIPMSQLQQRAGELESHRGRRIVVLCHIGGRSLQVAYWLRQQGFPNSQSMRGGIDEWAVKIDPSVPRY